MRGHVRVRSVVRAQSAETTSTLSIITQRESLALRLNDDTAFSIVVRFDVKREARREREAQVARYFSSRQLTFRVIQPSVFDNHAMYLFN